MNMQYDRNIADARRLARAEARASGIPYQQTLDAIAVRHGRTDWKAFVADPCVITQEARGQTHGEPEPAKSRQEMEKSPGGRRRSRRTILAIVSALAVVPAMTLAMKSPQAALEDSGSLSEQRRRASTTPLDSIVAMDGKTVYTTVRKIGRSSRMAMMTIFDYRPMTPWPGQRYVIPALAAVGVAGENWTMSFGGVRSYELAYHPVVRVNAVIECRTGIWQYFSSGLADDFVSPMSTEIENRYPERRRLSKHDLDILCSPETMRRSDHVRTLVGMPGYVGRPVPLS